MVVPGRELLHGVVELDETYVGGVSRGHSGRSSTKAGVMVAAEMLGVKRLGRIRLEPSPHESLPLIRFAQRIPQPRTALLPPPSAGEEHRPRAPAHTHRRHHRRRRIQLDLTQADTQYLRCVGRSTLPRA
jgi:hypothetical protein